MKRHALKLGCSLIAISALAACSDNNTQSETAVVVNPGSGPSQLNGFGTQFATAFRADPNSEPYVPADGDAGALSLTTEPVTID